MIDEKDSIDFHDLLDFPKYEKMFREKKDISVDEMYKMTCVFHFHAVLGLRVVAEICEQYKVPDEDFIRIAYSNFVHAKDQLIEKNGDKNNDHQY